MKCSSLVAMLTVIVLPVVGQSAKAPQDSLMTARDYYNELYKAGGLDKFAAQYVCFRNDDVPGFLLLAKGEVLKQFLTDVGGLNTLSAEFRKALDKGLLFMTTYNKGIPNGREYLYRDDSGAGYVEELDRVKPPLTIRLRVNWQTLRYKLDIEETGVPGELYDNTGKCEEVTAGISQHGDPDD